MAIGGYTPHMAQPDTTQSSAGKIPLWMRRSTLVVITILSAGAFGMVAYYLLPLWWAGLVASWIEATNDWVTGLTVGFVPVALGIVGLILSSRIVHVQKQRTQPSQALVYLRALLGAIAGVCLAAISLTILIAAGLTQPLLQARKQWAGSSWIFVALIMGASIALVIALGGYAVVSRIRQKRSEYRLQTSVGNSEDTADPNPENVTDR